jgi:thymidylate synthase (FAD)
MGDDVAWSKDHARTEVQFTDDMDVILLNSMADDRDAVDAARISVGVVSFAAEAGSSLSNKDIGLLNYLMKHRHASPFEHSVFKFYIRCPIFVAREFMRHRMMSFNERSGRYSELRPVFYLPARTRPLVQEGKPGDYQIVTGNDDQWGTTRRAHIETMETAWASYREMLTAGIAREVARNVLPVSIYTEFYVTANLRAWLNFLSLRMRSSKAVVSTTPQLEIHRVAKQIEAKITARMPVTMGVWEAHGRQGI